MPPTITATLGKAAGYPAKGGESLERYVARVFGVDGVASEPGHD